MIWDLYDLSLAISGVVRGGGGGGSLFGIFFCQPLRATRPNEHLRSFAVLRVFSAHACHMESIHSSKSKQRRGGGVWWCGLVTDCWLLWKQLIILVATTHTERSTYLFPRRSAVNIFALATCAACFGLSVTLAPYHEVMSRPLSSENDTPPNSRHTEYVRRM